jgi:hypothetical protein
MPTLLFCAAVISSGRYLFGRHRFLLLYCSVLMVSLGMIGGYKTDKYAVYLFPFWSLIIAGSVAQLKAPAKPRWVVWAVCVSGIAFCGNGIYYTLRDAVEKESALSVNHEAGSLIPEGAWCVAPLDLVFDQILRVNIVADNLIVYEDPTSLNVEGLARFCDRKGVEYVVSKPEESIIHGIINGRPRAELDPYFSVVEHCDEYTVLRRAGTVRHEGNR